MPDTHTHTHLYMYMHACMHILTGCYLNRHLTLVCHADESNLGHFPDSTASRVRGT